MSKFSWMARDTLNRLFLMGVGAILYATTLSAASFEGGIDLSLHTSATNPDVGEIIWVDLHVDSVLPKEYLAIFLFIHYDPEHLTLLNWERADGQNWVAGFPGKGRGIDYVCRDEAGQTYTCDADICRDPASQCTKVYTDFISTVIRRFFDNNPCPYTDEDPTDEFTPCFEDPPVERPINQEIDDGSALWTGNLDWWRGDVATTPGVPVRFSFRVRQKGLSCVRISESWKPFPGGNRYGAGPPDYQHGVTEMWSRILFGGGSLLRSLTDVCIDNREGGP